MKVYKCRSCGNVLTNGNWNPSQQKRHNYICKKCNRDRNREWYQKNRKKLLEKQRKYYHEHKNNKHFIETRKKWRKNNRESIRRRQKEWIQIRRNVTILALGGKCQNIKCGINDIRVLEIHHKYGRPKGERKTACLSPSYPLEKLKLLCANCHKVEEWERRI